jgi:hypothetical protein
VKGVVVLPLSVSEVPKECVKELAGFEFWIHLADVSNHYGIGNTTTVSEDVRIDTSVLGPQLDAP